MYDSFSSNYDRFVDWLSRLSYEIPFISSKIETVMSGIHRPPRILDAACGTGMHAIALAQRGWIAAGADLSEGMIARARQNAELGGVNVDFRAVGFGQLAAAFRSSQVMPFDGLVCLGNSLPHILNREDMSTVLTDFHACLRPGGVLIIQNRNFDLVLRNQQRWMEPQGYTENGYEWIFLRFYDFLADGLIAFNLITLQREAAGAWRQEVESSLLSPWLRSDLESLLAGANFGDICVYGDMSGAPYDPASSPNLVVTTLARAA